MSNNILDITRKNDSKKKSEGFANRLTLTEFKGTTGAEIQLTLGGYPYRFIHLNEPNVIKVRNALNEYLDENNEIDILLNEIKQEYHKNSDMSDYLDLQDILNKMRSFNDDE